LKQKYKTILCNNQKDGKVCKSKNTCPFAHGDEELRKPGDYMTPEQISKAMSMLKPKDNTKKS
jgi:hypothetical protein